MNHLLLSGRVGIQPQLHFTNNKKIPVCTLRMSTKEHLPNGDKLTLWHNVTVWGKEAETICKHVNVGDKVVVRGRIQYKTRLIDEKEIHQPEIVGEHVEFS